MSELKSTDPSEIAGRYQVVKKLGAGAFGTVYKAKDKILGRMVAIKTIRLDTLVAAGASMDEMLERFQREARVAAQIKHPNIVTMYDINQAEGGWYLAMEFIDGIGLERVIATEGRIPAERAAMIGAQVADALDTAHRAGIVHRDIKPANIMIEAGDRVKVTDFGIAKPQDAADSLTATGSLLGTPSYMSPEQARGGQLDGRSDLFSVGCVLYELVAGKKAFRGDSITGLIFKIITEEPPPLRELAPDVPEAYLQIVQKALAKSPEARYQSGAEMKADLDALVRPGSTPTVRMAETPTASGVPVAGASPTLAGQPTAIAGAPTQVGTPAAAATQVGAAPAAAATVLTPAGGPAPAPPPPPAPRAAAPVRPPAPPVRKSGGGLGGLLVALLLFGVLFVGVGGVAGWYFFLRTPAVKPEDLPSGQPTPAATESAPPATTPQQTAEASPEPGSVYEPPATPTPGARSMTEPGTQATDAPPKSRPPTPGVPTPAPPPQGHGDYAYLDDEGSVPSDAEAGQRLAEAYRGKQGYGSQGSYGASGKFQRRRPSPPTQNPVERAAIATLRHVMIVQEAYKRQHGSYGSFEDLKSAGLLRLDVASQARQFARKGYAFALSVGGEEFRVDATPTNPGLRPFKGDDSGFITVADE